MLSRPHLPAHWVWRIGFTTAALAWMLLIFYQSSLSSEEIESAWSLAPAPVSAWPGLIAIRQVVGHLAQYGVLALLVQSTIRSWAGLRLRPLVMAAAAVVKPRRRSLPVVKKGLVSSSEVSSLTYPLSNASCIGIRSSRTLADIQNRLSITLV